MPDSAPAATTSPPPRKQRFASSFWALNAIEMWERLAYYNLRVMAPIYIMQADDPGGLHLTAAHKGTIYAWWAIFQSLLPIVTGGFADRYGYKRVLGLSIFTMMIGYLMIAFARDIPGVSNYWALFTAIMVLATGTAFFKPSIQGSLAQNLTKENSSVGWGIFYWVVNVGAFVGHYLPGLLLTQDHSRDSWRNLFIASAAFTALNLLMLFTFKDVPSGADKRDSVFTVLKRTVVNIAEPRLVAWLAIMSGFWLMMYQLWDLQPNFIRDWVDSSSLVEFFRSVLPSSFFNAVTEQTPRGLQVPQQVLLSLNSFCIIIGVVGMAWLTRGIRTLTAMTFGMVLATIGILVAGWTMNVWFLLLGILCFSLGEMTTGPKKSEYLALIAPPGKKGLYLGYVNIPVGVGVFIGSKIAGFVYGNYGEKAVLAQKYLFQHTDLGRGRDWNGDTAALGEVLGVPRTEAFSTLMQTLGIDPQTATRLLWDTYTPQYAVWIPFAVVGVVSTIALWAFGRMARRWNDMNA
ncbi:MAG: MFS transporter [Phycisphaerales bacterium]|nr:MFS transporter [Phycisphaerales bacterium]